MAHLFDPSDMSKLDSSERRRFLPPEEILRSFSLSDGEEMVDIGAGIGYFTIPASVIVGPEGRVIALDVAPEMVEELRRRISEAGLRNVEVSLIKGYGLGLKPGSADFALLSTMLHEVEDPCRMLTEVSRLLRDGGRIGIVEWRPANEAQGPGPSNSERIAPLSLMSLLEKTGFVAPSWRNLNERFYTAQASRKPISE
jgi:ubiquinone/menaquinone biosynthesis C-methylase UbiE